MKRYRILSFDLDSRARDLEPVQDHWEDRIKERHTDNREKTIEGLRAQFGEWSHELKVNNFMDLGVKPFSVLAFHNRFLDQIRNAYVIGCYYPALTGACALGERILNHMVILLRGDHKGTPEYKKLYKKDSFNNWLLVVDTLEVWGDLLPEAAKKFRELYEKRNRAIHFNPEIDHKDRELSVQAIRLLQDIVSAQFSAFGRQPWYFCVPGEMYIKKKWEDRPFVKHVLIPNSLLVGPRHIVENLIPRVEVNDHFDYEDIEISDEEFTALRQSR